MPPPPNPDPATGSADTSAFRRRARVPPATWVLYVLLLGPGVVSSVMITGWILGAVGTGPLYYVLLHRDQVQVAATAVALVAGVATAVLRRRAGRARGRLARVPARLAAGQIRAPIPV